MSHVGAISGIPRGKRLRTYIAGFAECLRANEDTFDCANVEIRAGGFRRGSLVHARLRLPLENHFDSHCVRGRREKTSPAVSESASTKSYKQKRRKVTGVPAICCDANAWGAC